MLSTFQSAGTWATFPNVNVSNVTNFQQTWYNVTFTDSFPALNMGSMTNGTLCFNSGGIEDVASYDALLVALETNNQNGPLTFHGGNKSKYTAAVSAAATARAALIADHTWTITDGGVAP